MAQVSDFLINASRAVHKSSIYCSFFNQVIISDQTRYGRNVGASENLPSLPSMYTDSIPKSTTPGTTSSSVPSPVPTSSAGTSRSDQSHRQRSSMTATSGSSDVGHVPTSDPMEELLTEDFW